MTPTNTQFTIRDATMSDHDALESLWETRFGSADAMTMGDENLLELSTKLYSECDIFVATSATDDLIGFTVGFLSPPSAIHAWIGPIEETYSTAPVNGFIGCRGGYPEA